MNKKLCLLLVVWGMVALACKLGSGVMSAPLNLPPAASNTNPGTAVWAVGDKAELPTGQSWSNVGTAQNPTKFTYKHDGDTVNLEVYWTDANVVEVHVSSHDRVPCFYHSESYTGWILTDGYVAQQWLTKPGDQYGMLGFKDEVSVYFIFDNDVLKVSYVAE